VWFEVSELEIKTGNDIADAIDYCSNEENEERCLKCAYGRKESNGQITCLENERRWVSLESLKARDAKLRKTIENTICVLDDITNTSVLPVTKADLRKALLLVEEAKTK
jgi:hypothetical protein